MNHYYGEVGYALALMRARNQHPYSYSFESKNPPTKGELLQNGIPHTTISTIGEVVDKMLNVESGKKIKKIQIFNNKVFNQEALYTLKKR